MLRTDEFDAGFRQCADIAGTMQERLAELAREAYAHPRRGLWVPLNTAAAGIREVCGQLEAAKRLLDTWAGDGGE